LKRRPRALIASLAASLGALLLLASFEGAAFAADDDDPPLTAAEVSRMVPLASGVPAAVSTPASSAAEMPPRPTFTTPSVPPIESPGYDNAQVSAPQMQEIPQAASQEPPVATAPSSNTTTSNAATTSPDVTNYMREDPDLGPGIGTARDFVAEGEETSPIGFEVRESRCRLKTGEHIDGLLILRVYKGSPAAKAGLQSYSFGKQHALQAVAIGAGIAFPPAMLLTMVALPMIEYTEMGKSYDMIIGVDGVRVTNFLEFEDRMRNVLPGEVVYLNVVRNGKRLQVAVPVPELSTSASN
jgi:PDZ domain